MDADIITRKNGETMTEPMPLKGKEGAPLNPGCRWYLEEAVASAVKGLKQVGWRILAHPHRESCNDCKKLYCLHSKEGRCVRCEVDYWFADVKE